MKNKVVIVTGANSGIGKITATELARAGATVVMACRSQARGSKALGEIKTASGNDDVHLMLCDFSTQASIRDFAAQFQRDFDQLDVLVNNAGAIFQKRQLSSDGIEQTFAVNHMGYFLLTDLLLDMLIASRPSRIVNVSSDAHKIGAFNFDDYQREKKYSAMRAYGESKLANVLFTYALAERLQHKNVTVNALHPGFVRTNFGVNNGLVAKVLMTVGGGIFGITEEEGAKTSIYLASSPEVEGVTGKYFYQMKEGSVSAESKNIEAQRKLWELSESLIQPAPEAS